jgi:hypothetical protein
VFEMLQPADWSRDAAMATNGHDHVHRTTGGAEAKPPRLLDQVRLRARTRHLAHSTERAYVSRIWEFILFHHKRHPAEMREPEVNAYLTWLATERHVAASTQNQPLSALLFLYDEVLHQPLDRIQGVVRAHKPKRLPTVLSREEVGRVLAHLYGERHMQVVSSPYSRKHDPAGGERCRVSGRHAQAGHLPHAAAFFRHASP